MAAIGSVKMGSPSGIILPRYPFTKIVLSIQSILIYEKVEMVCVQSEIKDAHTKLMVFRQMFNIEGIHCPEGFDAYQPFNAEYLDEHWTSIKKLAGSDMVYFDAYHNLYMADTQLDFKDRKFLLARHIYPNMSTEDAMEQCLKIPPVDIASVIKRVVSGTIGEQIDTSSKLDPEIIKKQEMCEQDKFSGFSGLLNLERFEIGCNLYKVKNDQTKLRLVMKTFNINKRSFYCDPNNFDTYINFRSYFCNKHWALIVNASPYKLYFEAFKLTYMINSEEVDIIERVFILSKLLYPNLSMQEFYNKEDKLGLPADLDSIIEKAVCGTIGAQMGSKPAASQLAKVDVPPTCQGKHEQKVLNSQIKSARLTKKHNFPFEVANYFRSFFVYQNKIREIVFERKIETKRTRQRYKGEQENLKSIVSFTASFFDKSWSVIKNAARIRVMYFESLNTNYLAELKVDSLNRNFFLFQHLYPNMSLEELKYSVDRLIIRLPCDIAAAMKRAVYKTKLVQLNLLLPHCICPLTQLVPLQNARRQRQVARHAQSMGTNRGCKFTSILHVKLSKPVDASLLAECEQDQLVLVGFESQGMADIFRPLLSVRKNHRSLLQSKNSSLTCLILFEVSEYFNCALDARFGDLMRKMAETYFNSPEFLINPDFDCFSSYKARFLSTHLALINASDLDLSELLMDSFKERYLADSQLDIGSRKHLLFQAPHLDLKDVVENIKFGVFPPEYVYKYVMPIIRKSALKYYKAIL